jgi:hypothetical protein
MKVLAIASVVAIASASLGLVGCDQVASRQELRALRDQVIAQESKIGALQMENAVQDDQLNQFVELSQKSGTSQIFLDPASSGGYTKLDTSVAPFLITFSGTSPNADGAKLELLIGNISTARFSGGSLTVTYGPRAPTNQDEVPAWNAGLKTSTQPFATDLRAGTWNKVSIPLPGIKPDQLGHLRVSMDVDRVFLSQ